MDPDTHKINADPHHCLHQRIDKKDKISKMASVRVLERWKDPFEEEEERAIFVANVFSQMEGDEREGENPLRFLIKRR